MRKKILPIIIASAILIALLPLAIDWLIIGNNFPSNISNSDWVGFFGGYIGSIIGCIISLVGILWTINFTREQNRADRELQIRPFLDIRYDPSFTKLPDGVSWLGYVMINEWDDNRNDPEDTERGLLYLKNVGNGSATNIDISVHVENITVQYEARFSNQNIKVTSNSVRQGEEAAISFIITNNRIAPSQEDFVWDENGFGYYDHSKFCIPSNYNVTLILQYNDLLGNLFTQQLKFNTNYVMEYDKENGGKYTCSLYLAEKDLPEKK